MSHPAWVCGLKRMNTQKLSNVPLVTPCVGVWIETFKRSTSYIKMWSHPAWVCGLKHNIYSAKNELKKVTPCVGVWIETSDFDFDVESYIVTPCVGVWIETVVV